MSHVKNQAATIHLVATTITPVDTTTTQAREEVIVDEAEGVAATMVDPVARYVAYQGTQPSLAEIALITPTNLKTTVEPTV